MSSSTYVAVTRGIRVSVLPQYLTDESDPDDGRYFWAYTIDIENEGRETVKLRSRIWRITDETGKVEEVRGPGVVGQTPTLKPGESFRYTSGCPLPTPSGIMVGSFQMTTEDGEMFDVAVPAFSLDSPEARRVVN
jgi:ApaG protein